MVRNARSGSTHLLEPLAAEILRALVERRDGMSVAELAERLRDDEAPLEQWCAAIEAVLGEFRRLGLAEPEAP